MNVDNAVHQGRKHWRSSDLRTAQITGERDQHSDLILVFIVFVLTMVRQVRRLFTKLHSNFTAGSMNSGNREISSERTMDTRLAIFRYAEYHGCNSTVKALRPTYVP